MLVLHIPGSGLLVDFRPRESSSTEHHRLARLRTRRSPEGPPCCRALVDRLSASYVADGRRRDSATVARARNGRSPFDSGRRPVNTRQRPWGCSRSGSRTSALLAERHPLWREAQVGHPAADYLLQRREEAHFICQQKKKTSSTTRTN